MRRIVFVCGALVLLALSASPAEGGPFRRARVQPSYSSRASCATTVSGAASNCPGGVCPASVSGAARPVACVCGTSCACPAGVCPACPTSAASAALDEVNAKRAARGLRPFVHDPLLTAAAERCAAFRADRRLAGHTANDFAFLGGASAGAAGCAAWEPAWGWGSCCTYENWTHAGAAFVVGADGRRYMHLFVR